MSYLVMARKHRPRSFEEVVGQPHIVKTLKNALTKGRFAHAYIFYGPRGVGKTTTARILARALNCVNGPTVNPCGECPSCQEILAGTSLDVLELDAASNRGIDEIRNLRENVRFNPTSGKFRVYIIDEIHMLTTQAFNAFLKTLEEPPAHAVFIGATTEIEQVPRTVLSRVQRFNFRLVPRKEIADYLKLIAGKENIEINAEALDLIAGRANGSLRDGLGLLDQLAAFTEGSIDAGEVRNALGVIEADLFFRATDVVTGEDAAEVFKLVEDLSAVGADSSEFMRSFAEHFRDMLLVKSSGRGDLVEGTPQNQERLKQYADRLSELDIVRLMKLAFDSIKELKQSQVPITGLELRLLQMQKLTDTPELSELLKNFRGEPSPEKSTAPRSRSDYSESYGGAKQEEKELFDKGKTKVEPAFEEDQAEGNEADNSEAMSLSLDSEDEDSEPEPVDTQRGIERVKEKWSAVCETLKKHNNHLGFFLVDSAPVKLKGNNLEIASSNEFQRSRLSTNRQVVQVALKEVLNMTLVVKFSVSEIRPQNNHQSNSMKGRRELLGELLKEHPILKELVEKLDAEPI